MKVNEQRKHRINEKSSRKLNSELLAFTMGEKKTSTIPTTSVNDKNSTAFQSCRNTSSLVGKAYMVAGRPEACLHTMAILHVYQAELLRNLDESEEVWHDAIVFWATDLSLYATKEIAHSMSALVPTPLAESI